MRVYIFLILTIIFYSGCSTKIKTNYLTDGIIEYQDDFFGDTMTVRFKDGYCLSKAKFDMKRYKVIREAELTKYCKIVSVKDYSYNGEFIQELKGNTLNNFRDSFYHYLSERQRIEAIQNGKNVPAYLEREILKKYIGTFKSEDNHKDCAKNGYINLIINNNQLSGKISFKQTNKTIYSKINGNITNGTLTGKTAKIDFVGKLENDKITGSYKNSICSGTFEAGLLK